MIPCGILYFLMSEDMAGGVFGSTYRVIVMVCQWTKPHYLSVSMSLEQSQKPIRNINKTPS